MQTYTRHRALRWIGLTAALAGGCGPTPTPTSDAAASTDVVGELATPDVTPDRPPTCVVGAPCGNDCLPSDAPCWACGTLTYDATCRCRASASSCPPATGCDNPSPAGVGEFCGTYAWCNRACAAGLTCTGRVSADAGPRAELDYRRRCEVPRDASGDVVDAAEPDAPSDAPSDVPTFTPPSPDAPARACGTLTCGVGQVCIRQCSGIDAGARDLHQCVDVPAACRGAARCPCASVCGFSPWCDPVGDEVQCNGCA